MCPLLITSRQFSPAQMIQHWRLIAKEIGTNLVMAIPLVASARASRPRTHAPGRHNPSEEIDRYALLPYRVFSRHVDFSSLRDSVVVEVGPGDHIPFALLALGSGARKYVAIDRFKGDISGPRARQFYSSLLSYLEAHLPDVAVGLKDRNLFTEEFVSSVGTPVLHLITPVERAASAVTADFVFSYNVVEHLFDVEQFAKSTFQMIREGGVAVHRVDFAAHGEWAKVTNPFDWLRVPRLLWWAMGSNRGTPNRLRFDEVKTAFSSAGFSVTCEILARYDESFVKKEMLRMPLHMRQRGAESLSIKQAVFRCVKPACDDMQQDAAPMPSCDS